jgi:hypothetical protein
VKKIECPRCGTVNLEKFLTFPHCAGCSALLPDRRALARESVWRRPVGAGLWMSLVGLALAGVVALSFSSREPGEPRQMRVFGQFPRRAALGDELMCRLELDSTRVDGSNSGDLRGVSWQLARSAERYWVVVGVSPTPDASERRAGRVVWVYHQWPADERWSVRLRPRASGQLPLAVIAKAQDHYPAPWRGTLSVR